MLPPRLFLLFLSGLLLALVVLPATPALAGGGPAPYSVVVDVAFGPEGGPASLRDDIVRGLLRELDRNRCFASVARLQPDVEPQADLLLRLVITELEDRTEYEISLAQRDSPNTTPSEKRRLIARLEAQVRQEIWTLPEENLARVRRFKANAAYRPLFNEDGRYEVELRLVDDLVRSTRAFACKGGAKKLTREVERARNAAQ